MLSEIINKNKKIIEKILRQKDLKDLCELI